MMRIGAAVPILLYYSEILAAAFVIAMCCNAFIRHDHHDGPRKGEIGRGFKGTCISLSSAASFPHLAWSLLCSGTGCRSYKSSRLLSTRSLISLTGLQAYSNVPWGLQTQSPTLLVPQSHTHTPATICQIDPRLWWNLPATTSRKVSNSPSRAIIVYGSRPCPVARAPTVVILSPSAPIAIRHHSPIPHHYHHLLPTYGIPD